ncbi:hypothetical protein AVEN_123702-1 [Araneus ventricosus]|uniref:Uncharacterized protein n=1 Tax=Araneus ventricosus TaxID=182803 RepID=A0A4Y2QWP7_ARAVE|nr:hypothetical protein AVEN_123702-1 [Araneus ventricosus]
MCSILDYILKQHYSKTGSNEPLVAFGLVAGGSPGLTAKRNTNMGQILLKVISEGNHPIYWCPVRLLPQVHLDVPRSLRPSEDATLPLDK